MGQPYLPFGEAAFAPPRKVLRAVAADERGVLGRIVDCARRMWPRDTAFHLAARARVTPRAAENWLADATGMSGQAVCGLLRSDAGLRVLEQIMGEARPPWWADVQRFVKLAELERLQAMQEALLRDLERDREAAHAGPVGGLLPVAKPTTA